MAKSVNLKKSEVLWTPEQIDKMHTKHESKFGISFLDGMFYLYPNSIEYPNLIRKPTDLDDILITPFNRGDRPFASVTPTLCDDFIHLTKVAFKNRRPTDTPLSLIIHDTDEGRHFLICTIVWSGPVENYEPVIYCSKEHPYNRSVITEDMYRKMLSTFSIIKRHLLQYDYWKNPDNYTPAYDDVDVDEIADLGIEFGF